MRGTLEGSRFVADGAFGSLGGAGTFLIGPGTFRYAGPDGGVFSRDIACFDGWKEATTFDIQNDLKLTGEFFWEQGGFVKTGPGTLTLDRAGTHWVSRYGAGFSQADGRGVYVPNANGDGPTKGVTGFTLLEGKMVVKSGTWHFNDGLPIAMRIGGTTVDPANPNGGQEKSAVFQVDGGSVHFHNWAAIGNGNGYETTTPNEVPSSGIIVNGGILHLHKGVYAGRNILLPKDSGGNHIRQRTCPFVEVHGGELRIYNFSRVGFCDDPGADARIFVDGGLLVVKSVCNTSGSSMIFGSQSHGDLSDPRHAEVTVCSNGTFDVTNFYIEKNRTNVTVNLNVLDGGIYRNNTLQKNGTGAGCEMHVLFDGGIAEQRADGNVNWIKADLTTACIGTRGAVFRTGSGATSAR